MQRSVSHATFVIERAYRAAPAKVFTAFADPKSKAQWFVGPEGWEKSDHKLDFCVGGKESVSGGPKGGPVHSYNATIWDIVDGERIVASYEMHIDETRISVSIATTEIKPDGAGSKLIYTEQGAFLDGFDEPNQRERGTEDLFDQLERYLA